MTFADSAEPNDAAAINSITTCLLAINKWMSNHFLKLHVDKTEILLKLKEKCCLIIWGNELPGLNLTLQILVLSYIQI